MNRLLEWKNMTGKSVPEMAAAFRCSEAAVYKYLSGERKPTDPEILENIRIATNGYVTANAFFHPNLDTATPTLAT